ncbi:Transcription (TATA-box-binding) factor TFIID [uncultured virus]|nr:Transcription (TATA-box-binding) factor TFIID [uncultured virus]
MDQQQQPANLFQEYIQLKQYLIDHNIGISTITLDCKINITVDIDKFRNTANVKRKINPKKEPVGFYNQDSIILRPNSVENEINVKVFRNGSLQVTGCKDMNDFYAAVRDHLIKLLQEGGYITSILQDADTLAAIAQSSDILVLDPVNNIVLHTLTIRMIKADTKQDIRIDRRYLVKILDHNHSEIACSPPLPCTDPKLKQAILEYGPIEFKNKLNNKHACVNIVYKHKISEGVYHKLSIFAFQTGSIIITNAKNIQQVVGAHIFLELVIGAYRNQLAIKQLDPVAVRAETYKYICNLNQDPCTQEEINEYANQYCEPTSKQRVPIRHSSSSSQSSKHSTASSSHFTKNDHVILRTERRKRQLLNREYKSYIKVLESYLRKKASFTLAITIIDRKQTRFPNAKKVQVVSSPIELMQKRQDLATKLQDTDASLAIVVDKIIEFNTTYPRGVFVNNCIQLCSKLCSSFDTCKLQEEYDRTMKLNEPTDVIDQVYANSTNY